jgi:hypothetical protein
MNKQFTISFLPASFVIGSLLLGGIFFAVALWWLRVDAATAALLALGCVTAHWLLDLAHNAGHAIAAQRTGYPMIGVLLGEKLFFGRSLYPANEPPLHARVHITRALGGPILSTVLGIALVALTAVVWPTAGPWKWVLAWAAFQSFAIFGPGAFVPISFTDGGTLLKWWPLRNAPR